LTLLKFDRDPYITKLPGDTKYFLTSPSLAVTKITIENGIFSDRQSSRKGEEGSLSRKERKIVKKGGEWIQIVNGFIGTKERE
jgi:hypothetical protein